MSGFRMRRGSSTAWTAANPVLGQGEFGLDLNNSLFKVGNGVSSWTQLPYYTGLGIGTVSAGTTNATGPTLSFANSNGVTFGINGNTITASAAGGGGGGGAALSAGTQSANTGTVVFANSNGITFGMSGSNQITASHNGLTTQSGQAFSASGGSSTFQTLNFSNANGATFSNSAGQVALSYTVPTVTNSSFTVQAGTQTLSSVSRMAFVDGNGVSFGASTSNNGSITITASHNGLTTARASNDGIGLNTALTAGPLALTINSSGLSLNAGSAAGTTSGFAGNLISGSMTHNTAGLNLSLNHPAWLTTAAQSNHSHGNPTLALTNLSGTTASNSNGLTLSLSAAAPGGGGGAAISAGTQSANTGTIAFANSNGVSFGMSGSSQITASYDGLRGISVSNTILSPSGGGGTVYFNTGNNRIALSYDTFVSPNELIFRAFAPWVGMSTQGNTSGTTGILSSGDLVLVGGNNITLSQSTGAGGNTITISGAAGGGGNTESYKPLIPVAILNTQTYQISQSTSIVWPADVQNNESVGFARYLVSANVTSMASLATTINTSLAYSQAGTFRLVAYTRGTGANSQSLQSIASTSWSTGQGVTLTANTTGSQYSVSNAYSFPNTATASTSFSTSYAASVTNFQVSSTHLTALTAAKIQGVPWDTLLPPERIWFAFGVSTTSGSTGNASISNGGRLNTSGLGLSQVNLPYGDFGVAANASVHAVSGVGSFTTAGGGSTASLGFSNISSNASHIVPYFSVGRIV